MNRGREAIKAATEMGRALGLKQGAKVLRHLADTKGRVVGTNEIKEAAAAIERLAEEVDKAAKTTLNAHGATFEI
jgi:hypothetical protein